jgi:hypothetical protein
MSITIFQGLWLKLLFYHFFGNDEYCLVYAILCSRIFLTLIPYCINLHIFYFRMWTWNSYWNSRLWITMFCWVARTLILMTLKQPIVTLHSFILSLDNNRSFTLSRSLQWNWSISVSSFQLTFKNLGVSQIPQIVKKCYKVQLRSIILWWLWNQSCKS